MSEKRSYPTFTSEQNVDVVLVGLRRHRQVRDVRREYWISEAPYHHCRRRCRRTLDRLEEPAVAGWVAGCQPRLRSRPSSPAAGRPSPAEHWLHLGTTNPIESTFATVRHRTKITRGPGSRVAGLAMAFKLIEAAQTRWRTVNGAHLVALIRAGCPVRGRLVVERAAQDAA